MAFCYFETLQRIGDRHKFLEEETRLKSLQNMLRDVGFQEHLYEDFADDCYMLLRETASASNSSGLLEAFNDEPRSLSIITFLKVNKCTPILLHVS